MAPFATHSPFTKQLKLHKSSNTIAMGTQHPVESPHWLYSTHFNDPALSDLTLKLSDGTIVHAHRVLLCRQSKYFAKLIAGGLSVSVYDVFLCTVIDADSLARRPT